MFVSANVSAAASLSPSFREIPLAVLRVLLEEILQETEMEEGSCEDVWQGSLIISLFVCGWMLSSDCLKKGSAV